jgi:hypothetical protein
MTQDELMVNASRVDRGREILQQIAALEKSIETVQHGEYRITVVSRTSEPFPEMRLEGLAPIASTVPEMVCLDYQRQIEALKEEFDAL